MERTYTWVLGKVDPNPTITLEAERIDDASKAKLANLFTEIDEQLLALERTMASQEDYPDEDWYEIVFNKFPWLSGVVTVESTGEILTRRPEASMKPLNLEPLLEIGENWNDGRVRTHIEATDLGPEVYVANAFTRDRVWIGLTVSHFDFRSIMSKCPAPQELIVFTPDVTLWDRGNERNAALLRKLPWDDILSDTVQGGARLEEFDRSFTWLVRYLGEQPIIYATPDVVDE
ncbi:hypothetical protein [Desulfohalovibrio reitneri]|uniref:hypothetical protein n=1 Tax=Desulfohalovibrio reitneri TaxID=1307759 RepID=UPI000A886F7F|nr:hypothetical protein [Desulfohalovibrio reitneri]